MFYLGPQGGGFHQQYAEISKSCSVYRSKDLWKTFHLLEVISMASNCLLLEHIRCQRGLHIVLQGLSPKTEAEVPTESTDRLTLPGVLGEERRSKHSRKLVFLGE